MREHLPPSGRVELGDAVLAEVVQALQPLAAQDGVRSSALPRRLGARPWSQGDYDELAQVFQNLVQNAVKYRRTAAAGSRSAWCASAAARAEPRFLAW